MQKISFPQMSVGQLLLWVSLYFTAVLNIPFLRAVFQSYLPTGGFADYFIYTVPVLLFLLCYILFNILALPFVHKIIIPVLIIAGAAVSYHSLFFNVYFDKNMLENVLQTNRAESLRMLSFSYIAWLLVLGILPAVLYLCVKIRYAVWYREIAKRLLSVAVSFLPIFGIAAVFYQDYASFFRNHLSIKHLIIPSNFMAAGVSKIKSIQEASIPYQALAKDAELFKPDQYRHVTIVVLGETTRAQNWGLNGYTRQTTPNLAKRMEKGEALINFPNVQSCGTFTALSVPCMFSSLTRKQYDERSAQHQDNLLDVFRTAGIRVHWIENNSDCKGVCKNVPVVDTVKLNLTEFCTGGECLDNIMLPEIDKILAEDERDTVLVLHTIGSHGPTYFERYTAQEKLFSPTCDTQEINRCNRQQLINTYDNGIVYIDQFLDKVIAKLAVHDDWESALFYISDHGESLGENGIYLHSTPYSIAPKTQTAVPMVMWFSPTWVKNEPFDLSCVQKKAAGDYSHDNIFHTVLSMQDMKLTSVKQYDAQLDILAACRQSRQSRNG